MAPFPLKRKINSFLYHNTEPGGLSTRTAARQKIKTSAAAEHLHGVLPCARNSKGWRSMKLFSYLSVAVLLGSSVVLTAYSPDLLSMVIVGFMCMIALAGSIYGLLPTISFTSGLLNGQNSIRKASGTEGTSTWVAALQIDRFFHQKTLDKLFAEYREKVQHQRETGQIVSDIDEVLNEDVLALYTWRGVIAQIPGTLTGLGILGTFVGLLLGLRNISFITVEAALGSVQSILAGIDTAFYTSIAGVILSILFNIINNVLRNIMNRETGLFLENFHKTVIPTTDEQARYSSRREVRQILELLDRLPKNSSNPLAGEAMNGAGGNERVLMPQILEGLRRHEFTFFLQPQYELNTRKVIGAEALVRWNHPVLGVVSPSVFIPVLESNGYITKLDQYIWEQVCQTIRAWIDQGIRPLPISVNVTKTDILAMDVAEFFSDMLKKYRIPPKYLDIDIAKSAYLETHGALGDTIAQLQQMGFRVILDGFDGDYIGLSAVGEMGTDVLKLDLRSAELANKTTSLPAIFAQARSLRLTLLAEGIESADQLNALRKCGCTEGQGYFFSRPLSVSEFATILKVGHAG